MSGLAKIYIEKSVL